MKCCLTLLLLLLAEPALAQVTSLERALSDELHRSLEELSVEGLERPYFLAYRVDDVEARSAAASFGSLLAGRASHTRQLTVEIRLGAHDLDNSNFLSVAGLRSRSDGGLASRTRLTLDDDYASIRRQVWLATDAAFKKALEQLAQKKAVLQNKTLADELPDFGRAEPLESRSEVQGAAAEVGRLESLAEALSERFKQYSAVHESRVTISDRRVESWYLNSEGSRFKRSALGTQLTLEASTQAPDGIPLEDTFIAVANGFDRLPEKEALVREADSLGSRLTALRTAELLDRYNGPVLFEEGAAAELFAQVFARQLLARRDPLVGDERLANLISQSTSNGFQDRIGARVLPRFVSVADQPSLTELEGAPLLGGYSVDDQGTPAATTQLIERGYLKRLLSGRTPTPGVPASSGNWRRSGVAPSNLVLTATTTASDDELLAELQLLVKDRGADFGVIVRRLEADQRGGAGGEPIAALLGSGGGGAPSAVVAFKVFPDGREVPLRNVELAGMTAATFKEIVAVGARRTVHSVPFAPGAGLGAPRPTAATNAGLPIVSVVVPALLFEEVTLRKPSDDIPSLPVSEHPHFASGN